MSGVSKIESPKSRDIKFGIAVPNFGKYADKEAIVEIALSAEGLGYDSVWVSDHIVIPESHKVFGDMFYDPLTTLGYLAAKTKKIRLGTSVLVLPYRNPVVLAKMVSTLDVVSDGRAILGVGSGWIKAEFDALGVAYDKRGKLTDEYIEIIKELWTSDHAEYSGKEFAFSNISFLPKPYQNPHPPVWVGGQSKKSIQRAARYGDGWHPVGLTPEQMKEKVTYLNEILSEEKREAFVISLRRNVEINKNREFSSDETLRGCSEKIMKGIWEYIDAGVSYFVLYMLSGDLKGVLQTMERFSTTIMPAIR